MRRLRDFIAVFGVCRKNMHNRSLCGFILLILIAALAHADVELEGLDIAIHGESAYAHN